MNACVSRHAALWVAQAGDVVPPAVLAIGYEARGDVAPIRVLVVAGDPLARAGLAAVVRAVEDCVVVGQVPPGAELDRAVDRLDPDVVVWDAAGADPSTDLADLGEGVPPVLMLASAEPRTSLPPGDMVRGVLPRDADAPMLGAALRAVAGGLFVADPAFRGVVPAARAREAFAPREALTRRESDVLQLLAAGLPNKLIAERLGISEHTVRFHLSAIFGKLGAHSRTEAVARAARLGLIAL